MSPATQGTRAGATPPQAAGPKVCRRVGCNRVCAQKRADGTLHPYCGKTCADQVVKTRSMASVHSQVAISGAGAGSELEAMSNAALNDYHQAEECPFQLVHIDNQADLCFGALAMGFPNPNAAEFDPWRQPPHFDQGVQIAVSYTHLTLPTILRV